MSWLTGRYQGQVWVYGELVVTKRFWRKSGAEAFQEAINKIANLGGTVVQASVIVR